MDSSSSSSKPPSILAVDDTPANLSLLSGMLKKGGYRVRPVSDGALALQAAAVDPPDLVLLDISMPEMDGFEVCARLKADPALKEIPVIFISAHTDTLDKVKAFSVGGVDYVTKPFQFEEVQARVAAHLEASRAREVLANHNAILERTVAERTEDLRAAHEELKASYLDTVDLVYAVLSHADDHVGNHSRRVATYVSRLAQHLGLDGETTFDLRVAALLHDIGLVGIPAPELERLARLSRPSPKTDQLYWNHPLVQPQVLASSARFSRVSAVIAAHHENMDGSGFPVGLKGTELPLSGRVLAVADRWDESAEARSLAPPQQALASFADHFQGKLDGELVQAFCQVLREGDPFSSVGEVEPAELKAGMVVASPIRTRQGAVLLRPGKVLRPDLIRDLLHYIELGDLELPIHAYREGVR